jgi:hypothetical protein
MILVSFHILKVMELSHSDGSALLFVFFQKRVTHRIYPDPTNLICFVSRFFRNSISGQWVLFHFMFLFPALTYLVSIGVHMGSNQVLPAFFANLSSFLAPVFFMAVASSLW